MPWVSFGDSVFSTPIPVALPLFMAAVLAALNRRVRRELAMSLAILTSVIVAGAAVSLVVNSRYDPIVYWFGGWVPRGGTAIGICFVVDNTGAMLVLVAAILVTAALVFSWCYFDTAGSLFQVLLLIFLGAIGGFSLTGDLFNLFVFFELMSVSAFALCSFKSESPGPLAGALNFAVTNTIGSFLVLCGIALVYGRTGALNLAQLGRVLDSTTDGLLVAAFVFLASGFFIKAAIVPFHFWLADAHTVAPAPVCVLFSGIMVELGLFAVVRIYWAVFSTAMAAHQNDLRNILVAFGAVTALLGALMCYAQRHLKRMLAFSTISHMGLMLVGVGLLTREGLAGASIYAMGHAMIKGALFLAAGILLHRTGTVDEIELTARVRHLRWTGAILFLGAAGLAGIPPFGTFWGENMISASAWNLGYGWTEWVFFLSGGATAAALFRFAGHTFLRWGPAGEQVKVRGLKIRDVRDTEGGHWHTPASMYVPAAALMVAGVLVGLAPRLTGAAESAAIQIQDHAAYAGRVLDLLTPYPPTVHEHPATGSDLRRAFATVLAAGLLAALTLGSARVRRAFRRRRFLVSAIGALRHLHSGIVPDYVTWLLFGVAAFGAAAFLSFR